MTSVSHLDFKSGYKMAKIGNGLVLLSHPFQELQLQITYEIVMLGVVPDKQ